MLKVTPIAIGSQSGVCRMNEIYRRSVCEKMTMMDTKKMDLNTSDTRPDDLPASLQILMLRERLKRGLSLRAGAELIGISHTELSRIEKGIRQCPSLVTLQMIATAYDLDVNSLTRYAATVTNPACGNMH